MHAFVRYMQPDFEYLTFQLPDVPVTLQASWALTHVHTEEEILGSEEITLQKEDVVLEIRGVEPVVEAYKALRPKGKIKSCLLDVRLFSLWLCFRICWYLHTWSCIVACVIIEV